MSVREFDRVAARSKAQPVQVVLFSRSRQETKATFAGDGLLVILDRDNHIVTDVAYRTEGSE